VGEVGIDACPVRCARNSCNTRRRISTRAAVPGGRLMRRNNSCRRDSTMFCSRIRFRLRASWL